MDQAHTGEPNTVKRNNGGVVTDTNKKGWKFRLVNEPQGVANFDESHLDHLESEIRVNVCTGGGKCKYALVTVLSSDK